GMALNGQHQSVTIYFYKPMNTTSGCFTDANTPFTFPSCSNRALDYSPVGIGNSFDLNAIHTFTFEMKLYPVSHVSWVAFHIDNNAWMNVTQQACNCLDGSTGGYSILYPYME